ncbi:MAG: hypothetical protein ABSE51_06435 [Terracidiphilus sp.]|jgi:hypothetical protein
MPEEPIKLFATRSELYPEPRAADVAQGTVRAGLAAIPLVGGSITELMSMVLTPAVARRRDGWLKDLADDFEDLKRKVEGFKFENLAENEAFVSAKIQATLIAIGTHQQEKRKMLRNALLNIALGHAPDEDVQQMFLSYLDSLTSWHIRILAFFKNPLDTLAQAERELRLPQGPPGYLMGSPNQILERTFPDLQGQRLFYDQIIKDLYNRGLVISELIYVENAHLDITMMNHGATEKRTTDAGDSFLAFVSSPI